MMAYTTLAKIRKHNPCKDGWKQLLRYLGKTGLDNEPLSLKAIFDSNGFNDALWCLRAVAGIENEIRLYAVWCARRVQHFMKDQRSVAALDVAERFALGKTTKTQLAATRKAAQAVVEEAAWESVARKVTREAAWKVDGELARKVAQEAAWQVAGEVAWEAVMEVVREAAWAVADAAACETVMVETRRAIWMAARQAEKSAQSAEFIRRFCTEET